MLDSKKTRKMKNQKFIYILMMGATIMASCKKSFLDEVPPSAVTVTESIKTENDLADAVNGMYNSMKVTTLFGRDIPVLGDLMADNTYVNITNSGRYLTENNFTFISTSTEASNIWGAAYYSILQANRVIYEGHKQTATNNVNQLVGEAYASRALIYLELVNFFATPYTVNPSASGVPLVTVPEYVSGGSIQPVRASVSEVYAKIISDLDSAYTVMPTAGTTLHTINSDYIAKYAAKALQARVYLYKGDYASARDAALLVVQSGGYSLATTAAAFSTYWTSATANTSKLETILELNQNASSNLGNTGLDAIFSQAGYGDIQATTDLYNTYTSTDLRRTLILNSTRGGSQAYIINKFSNYSNTDKDETKIIRYAEVLLTLAESYARLNDTANALIYLNQVAKARDLSFLGYTSVGTQLITDILTERRKELAFEGLRFFDFTRLNLAISRPAQTQGAASYPTVSTTDFRRLQPIPQGEMDANKNMVQNSGY
jgi:hypothetical protein